MPLILFHGRNSKPVGFWSPMYTDSFDTPHPPSHVYLGFIRLDIRRFIPPPRRSFRCQIFRNLSRTCRHTATCSHFDKLPHRPCPNPASYINCGGPHPSDPPTFLYNFLRLLFFSNINYNFYYIYYTTEFY